MCLRYFEVAAQLEMISLQEQRQIEGVVWLLKKKTEWRKISWAQEVHVIIAKHSLKSERTKLIPSCNYNDISA